MVCAKQQIIDDEGVFTALTTTQMKLDAVQHELSNQQILMGQCFHENKQLREQISALTRGEKMALEKEKAAMITISKTVLVPDPPSPEKKEDTSTSISPELLARLELVTQLKATNEKVCGVILLYSYCCCVFCLGL